MRHSLSAAVIAGSLLLSSVATAGGPISSRFGLGLLAGPSDPRSYAMGFTSIGLGGTLMNTVNPAGLAGILHTQLQGGFSYGRFLTNDGQATSTFARGDFQGLAIAFPIDSSRGIAMLAAAEPYSQVQYAVRSTVTEGGITSTQTFRGSGGLSKLSLGFSCGVLSRLTLGLQVNYIYGRIGQTREVDFSDPLFTDSNVDRSWYHSGYNFTLGALFRNAGSLLGIASLDPLTLGAVVNTSARLDVREEQLFTSVGVTDTLRARNGKTTLPLGAGAGLSLQISQRLLLSADIYWQQWDRAEMFSGSEARLRNTLRTGIGIEVQPGRDRSGYFDRVVYRAGMAYRQGYADIGGHPNNEFVLTGGTGLPIGPESLLNIGFQVGTRGTLGANKLKDTIFGLSLSVTASEEWFMELIEE